MNIGQASKASGVSQRMIRHYEKLGLIPSPARRDSGYRDYTDADVDRLLFIADARELNFPIAEIAGLLSLLHGSDRADANVRSDALTRADDLARKAVALERMRAALVGLAGGADAG